MSITVPEESLVDSSDVQGDPPCGLFFIPRNFYSKIRWFGRDLDKVPVKRVGL